jgi:hypothetical protein
MTFSQGASGPWKSSEKKSSCQLLHPARATVGAACVTGGNRLPRLHAGCYKAFSNRGVCFPAQRGPLTLFYGILFLLSGITNFAFTLMILRELSTEKKGLSFFDLRWYVLKNLNTYQKLTRSRYGKVGFPYYAYLVTLAALVLSAILCLDSLAR